MSYESFALILLCIASATGFGSTKGIDYHNREHLQSHVEGEADLSRMSEEELKFVYFKSHDTDNDNRLDGYELVQSIIHFQTEESVVGGEENPVYSDDELAMLVDPILASMDKNGDGFIDYPEFVAGPGIIAH